MDPAVALVPDLQERDSMSIKVEDGGEYAHAVRRARNRRNVLPSAVLARVVLSYGRLNVDTVRYALRRMEDRDRVRRELKEGRG